MEFSKQEYCSGFFLTQGPRSPALQVDSLPSEPTGKLSVTNTLALFHVLSSHPGTQAEGAATMHKVCILRQKGRARGIKSHLKLLLESNIVTSHILLTKFSMMEWGTVFSQEEGGVKFSNNNTIYHIHY